MAEVQHTFELVDTFQHVNKSESYTKVNPTQSVPMITDVKWKILGDGITSYAFLVENYPEIKTKFYNEAQETMIHDMFRHFNSVVKKTTTVLIRSIVNKKVFNTSKPIDQVKLDQNLNYFSEIMLRYEKQLKKEPFLTGKQITFVDVIVFIEIETVLLMYR